MTKPSRGLSFSVFLVVISAVFSGWASGARNAGGSLCQAFLGNKEIGFEALMPEIGKSLLEVFPESLAPGGKLQVAVILAASQKNSVTKHSESLKKFPPASTPLREEGNVTYLPSKVDDPTDSIKNFLENILKRPPKPKILLGPSGIGKSELAGEIRAATHSFKIENPEWRKVVVGIRDIRDFWIQAPVDRYESLREKPLRILPREWQGKLLSKLIQRRPSVLAVDELERHRLRSLNSSFSLKGEAPLQPLPIPESRDLDSREAIDPLGIVLGSGDEASPSTYRGNLDPLDPKIAELLYQMRRYYFHNRKVLNERDLFEVYLRHIYFKIEEIEAD